MKSSIVLLIASILIASSTQADLPECIQKQIDGTPGLPNLKPISISKYSYRGQTMYFFTSSCCDQFNDLYDDSCNRICAPSGGFIGRGDGQCPDFDKNAKYLGNVWTNQQKSKK